MLSRRSCCCRWSSYFDGPDRLKAESPEPPAEHAEQNGSHEQGEAKMNGITKAVGDLSVS